MTGRRPRRSLPLFQLGYDIEPELVVVLAPPLAESIDREHEHGVDEILHEELQAVVAFPQQLGSTAIPEDLIQGPHDLALRLTGLLHAKTDIRKEQTRVNQEIEDAGPSVSNLGIMSFYHRSGELAKPSLELAFLLQPIM